MGYKINLLFSGYTTRRMKLKKEAVPSQFLLTAPTPVSALARNQRLAERASKRQLFTITHGYN